MRTAIRRNSSGGVARVAQRHERVVDERVLDEVDGHRRTTTYGDSAFGEWRRCGVVGRPV